MKHLPSNREIERPIRNRVINPLARSNSAELQGVMLRNVLSNTMDEVNTSVRLIYHELLTELKVYE